ncbi:MAG: hypothetical protein MI923_08335 [Phycisphaerales bacterium]|nr:hypothetical protein [Phycisphaerales bacterium]
MRALREKDILKMVKATAEIDELEAAVEEDERSRETTPTSKKKIRRSLLVGVPIAAAACLIYALGFFEDDYSSIGVAFQSRLVISGDPDGLFIRKSGPLPVHDEFWIGVEVDTPRWFHFIERISETGELRILTPARSSIDYAAKVEAQRSFGPFDVRDNAHSEPRTVSHVWVIESRDRIPNNTLRSSIPDKLDEVGIETAFRALAQQLKVQYGCGSKLYPIRVN